MWKSLKQGLEKTSQRLREKLNHFFTRTHITAQDLQEIADILIMADIGPTVCDQCIAYLREHMVQADQLYTCLANYLANSLLPFEKKFLRPRIIMVVGVNGSGKTTTLGKLAHKWILQGIPIHFVAADTFRAAAVEQLTLWAQKMQSLKMANVQVTSGGKDPASVVFRGLEQAQPDEIILIDTAGRLPHKVGLMDELRKINDVIKRLAPMALCETLLVLDANIGQHALVQADLFKKTLHLTGLIMNKMDGTAKGGILVNVTHTHQLPVYGLGVGEKADDLIDFNAKALAHALLGLTGE